MVVLNQKYSNGQPENKKFLAKFQNTSTPEQIRNAWPAPTFDLKAMMRLLDHDNHDERDRFRKYIKNNPLFIPRYNMSLDQEREIALKRLKSICENGFISVMDFKNNPLKIFAAHELAICLDPAMGTKMTVQFNLFGGTMLKLGTERHHHLDETDMSRQTMMKIQLKFEIIQNYHIIIKKLLYKFKLSYLKIPAGLLPQVLRELILYV